MTIGLDEIKDHVGHKIVCTCYEEDHNYVIECETCWMILFEWDSELYGEKEAKKPTRKHLSTGRENKT